MLVLRTFLALLAGFIAMALTIGVATAVLIKRVPEWSGAPGSARAGYIFVNLGFSFAAALAGGYVTGWVARDNPLVQVLALAIAVLLLAALSALQQRGHQPIWYQLMLVALTPAGVFLGGLLRLRVMGI